MSIKQSCFCSCFRQSNGLRELKVEIATSIKLRQSVLLTFLAHGVQVVSQSVDASFRTLRAESAGCSSN